MISIHVREMKRAWFGMAYAPEEMVATGIG